MDDDCMFGIDHNYSNIKTSTFPNINSISPKIVYYLEPMDLKLYLALAGGLGIAYASYTYLNKPRPVSIVPKDLTKRISQ